MSDDCGHDHGDEHVAVGIDPVNVLMSSITDIARLSEMIDGFDPTPEQQMQYLQAVDHLTEQIETLSTVLVFSATQRAMRKIEPEARAKHQMQREAVDRMRELQTPDEERQDFMRKVAKLAQRFAVQVPPGMRPPDAL